MGLWIRNNWIYPLDDDELESFMKMFEDEDEEDDSPFGFHIIHPDDVSCDILDKYVEYLKEKD